MKNTQLTTFLNDFAEKSGIEFLEEGKKNEIIQVAKARGINLKNNKDLSGIKCIYAFADRQNKNRAILPERELLKILPTMISKPINVGHQRQYVIGHMLDFRYIQKGKMVIMYGVIYRSNFGDEWEQIKKDFKAKKLHVSFEIWSPEDKRKYNSDGSYELHDMEISGCAILFRDVEPAFDGARVLALAKKLEQETPELVFASKKYKCADLLTAKGQLKCSKCGRCKKEEPKVGGDYFKESVEENLKKLQEDKKSEQNKKEQPKTEEKKAEIKTEPKPEEIKTPPEINKIKCSNCSEEMDYNGIDVRIKCPKCFAILNKEGVMQYPPQIKDFNVLCSACKVGNWLILSKDNKEAKIRCENCAKEYKIDFVQTDIKVKDLLSKFDFLYSSVTQCPQCHKEISVSGVSSSENMTIKCPKCKIEFVFKITHEAYKKISKIEEIKIDKIEKSARTEKGGKEMDYKLELSKFHRYIDVERFEDFEKSLPKDYAESKETAIEKLTTEQRNALPDSGFAVVVRVKNKKTGKIRKVRILPIPDEAHVKNALANLEQTMVQDALKKLGVSIKDVKTKLTKLLESNKKPAEKKVKAEPKKAKEEPKVEVKKVEKKVDTTTTTDKASTVTTTSDKVKTEVKIEVKETPKVEKKVEAKKEKTEIKKTEEVKIEPKKVEKADKEKELLAQVEDLKKKLENKDKETAKKIEFYKENAKKIYARREKLGDFAKDISDEDIINEDKYENAQLKKQLAEAKKIETASENVGDKTKETDTYAETRKRIDEAAFKGVKK